MGTPCQEISDHGIVPGGSCQDQAVYSPLDQSTSCLARTFIVTGSVDDEERIARLCQDWFGSRHYRSE